MIEEDFKAHPPASVLPVLKMTGLLGTESHVTSMHPFEVYNPVVLRYSHSSAAITTADFIRFQPLKSHRPCCGARVSLLPVAERCPLWMRSI